MPEKCRQVQRGQVSNLMRFFWLFVACLFLSSCSTYSQVSLPRLNPSTDISAPEARVKTHDSVRLTLLSGEQLIGDVIKLTFEKLLIQDQEMKEFSIPFNQIELVEVKNPSKAKQLIYFGVAIVIIAGIFAIAMVTDTSLINLQGN